MIHTKYFIFRVLNRSFTTSSRLSSAKDKVVGFVGLGNMGSSMARNILAAKQSSKLNIEQLLVYDISKDKVNELVAEGAVESSSLIDIGKQCDVVLTMVRHLC